MRRSPPRREPVERDFRRRDRRAMDGRPDGTARRRRRETAGFSDRVRYSRTVSHSRPSHEGKSAMGKLACSAVVAAVMLLGATLARTAGGPITEFPLDSVSGLLLVDGTAEVAEYRGHRAVRLVPRPGHDGPRDSVLAILTATDVKDGTIEARVAGAPRPGAPPDARGFIGIAFHVQPHGSRYECFYLRPSNARADRQLQRNHSAQYVSEPDHPWFRLRDEHPGEYESYVDLEPGAWTRIRIAVAGTKARLYVNGADQPTLIVNDLKLGDARGPVALWAHWSTDAYFSSLTIR